MSPNDSDSNEESCPKKKLKLDNREAQLHDNFNAFTQLSFSKSVDDSNIDEPIGSDQNNVANKPILLCNVDSNIDDNQSESEESNLDNSFNVNNDCESDDDYVPISDSEFELQKCCMNNETNKKTNINECTSVTEYSKLVDDTLNKLSTLDDNDAIHDLLDKAYKDKNQNPNDDVKKPVTKDDYQEYEKIVLEEVCKNHFDILPENWIEATHKSGMPVYLHKKTRVVVLTRPYFLGPGDSVSHLAPLSAISCLQYRKGIESKEHIKNEPDFQVSKLGDMIIPNAKIETAQENIIKESLTHDELREYCQKLFKLAEKTSVQEQTVEQDTNLDNSNVIQNDIKERPSLPVSTKLISFPVQTEDHDKRNSRRREWIMNPNGKSYVSILHEYLQQALKTQPWYEFKELENTDTPYSATVVLNDVQYGVGLGNSKKQAKLNAAQATLNILIPEMKHKIDTDSKKQCDPVIFDQIKVTDPRVTEFCAKTTEPSPYAMLLVCLQRNFGECDVNIEYKLNNRRRMLNQCTMTVGKHVASVACKNKRDGKQKASQVILGLLHPHIDNWGSLLRLYGNRSIKNAKEKKQEEQEITQLQSKAALNQPNFAILNKLKEEMIKVRDLRLSKIDDNLLKTGNQSTSCPYTISLHTSPSSSSSMTSGKNNP